MATSFKCFGAAALNTRHIIRKAAFRNNRLLTTMSESLDKVSDVNIDGHGRFKYILIKVDDKASNATKQIVRGYAWAQWHADIYDRTVQQLEQYRDLQMNCVGGGRIEHDPDEKTIKVYGYSQGFGKADHEVSVALLKKKYPDYNITCSDEGY